MRGAEILIVLLLFPVLSCTAQASRPTPTPDLPATVEALVGRRLSEILTAPAGAPALTMTPSPTVTPTHSPKPPVDYITFGSTKEDVLRIQGEPTAVSHEDWWWYGNDYILFDGLAGRVVGWENRFGNVKVKLK